MSTLLIRLESHLQTWADQSHRGMNRGTGDVPTFSGVIGIIGASLGIPRTSPRIAELARDLSFAVRVDRAGTREKDFHTGMEMPFRIPSDVYQGKTRITYRVMLSGASFLAAVSGEDALIEEISQALRKPVFQPYLGKKSCVPSRPLFAGVVEEPAEEALLTHSLDTVRQELGGGDVHVTSDGSRSDYRIDDDPRSFDPRSRSYGTRLVRVDSIFDSLYRPEMASRN